MATPSNVGLTRPGKVVVTILVLALAGGGFYLMRDKLLPKGLQSGSVNIQEVQKQLTGGKGGAEAVGPQGHHHRHRVQVRA